MREDLAPRLLDYLRAALERPRLAYAEAPAPVSGGCDTEIFTFRLNGAVPALSGPLVLRVLPPHHDRRRALRERAVQNAVADLGSRRPLPGLEPAMRWLLDHRPDGRGARAICHGDFHPQNLLVEGRGITAVLDWPNVLVADPAYDVAATKVILEQVPLAVLPVSPAVRWAVAVARRLLIARYLRGYRRRRPLDRRALAYGEALACMRGLVTAKHRAGARAATTPLDASSYGDRLAARFVTLTGIRADRTM